MKSIHPFPARMAPELAIAQLDRLVSDAVVLDPMSGSGTVVRHAAERGLKSYGFDLDPLAVLISRVSTRRHSDDAIKAGAERALCQVRSLKITPELPWLDGDPEAQRFIDYWYGERQRDDLRKIAHVLSLAQEFEIPADVCDVLRIALSRIIVTKSQAASLAQDTSHSRPHRVVTESTYDVLSGLENSIRQLRRRLEKLDPTVQAVVERGDARKLVTTDDASVDLVLTSPPYLNALDYMRGHRMSLIWLGHRYAELSKTRSTSIGAERAPDEALSEDFLHQVQSFMGELGDLPPRFRRMTDRYVGDLFAMTCEVFRVLRPGGQATFVMGDSCLRGVFISNSNGLAAAAELAGLKEVSRVTRELPAKHRYLPTPDAGALAKRMKKETILTFTK
jgi:hypothetical protein